MKSIFILILFFNIIAPAQDKNNYSIWGEAGLGVSFLKFTRSDAGLSHSVSINYKIGNDNFSAGYYNSSEFVLFIHPYEYVKSYEIKYGKSIDFKMRGLLFPTPLLLLLKKDFNYSFSAKVGVSYIESLNRTYFLKSEIFSTTYARDIKRGFGVPVELELREEITSFAGLGFTAYMNFNNIKNYTGFHLTFYLGYF